MRDSNSRPGRWRTGEASRKRILDAARSSFGQHGYDRTTIRAVAAEAHVDPAMIHYFFTSKSRLFAAAMEFPLETPERLDEVLDADVDNLGERIVRHFLGLWHDESTLERVLALMKSAPVDDESASMLTAFIRHEFVARISTAIASDDAELRAELVGSLLLGLTVARYGMRIEPLASTSADTIVAWLAPTVQQYISGPVPERPTGVTGRPTPTRRR